MGNAESFFHKLRQNVGMKCQGVFVPNGMLTNVYFKSLAQNDKGLIHITGLEEELGGLLEEARLPNGSYPVVYADDIYEGSTVII